MCRTYFRLPLFVPPRCHWTSPSGWVQPVSPPYPEEFYPPMMCFLAERITHILLCSTFIALRSDRWDGLPYNLGFPKFFLVGLANLPKYRLLNYLCLTLKLYKTISVQPFELFMSHIWYVQNSDAFKMVMLTNMT